MYVLICRNFEGKYTNKKCFSYIYFLFIPFELYFKNHKHNNTKAFLKTQTSFLTEETTIKCTVSGYSLY